MTIKMRCISLTEVTLIECTIKYKALWLCSTNQHPHTGVMKIKLHSCNNCTSKHLKTKEQPTKPSFTVKLHFLPTSNTTSGRSVSKTWEICMTLTVCAQNMIMTPFQYLKLHWTQSLFHFICTKEKNSNSRN